MSREQIRQIACRLFNTEVRIDERAYQSLECVYPGDTPHVTQVWNSLIHALPSVHILFEAFGIEEFLSETSIRPDNRTGKEVEPHATSDEYWEERLQSVFSVIDAETHSHFLTEAGETVKATGKLSIDTIVRGILESGELRYPKRKPHRNLKKFAASLISALEDPPEELDKLSFYGKRSSLASLSARRLRHSKKLRRANPVLALAAQKCGASLDGVWNARLRLFSSTAIDVFDNLHKCDESFGDQQFILYHDGRRIKIAPFGVFGSYQLSESPLPDGSLWIARSNVLQPTEKFRNDALETLEELINSEAKETEFQKFFESNPEFLLLLGDYTRLHSQLILQEDSGRLIPDFFLEKINSDFCDICDLKRPNAELVRQQRHRDRFRDSVMEAVSQLTYYRDWFEDRVRREMFFSNYGLRAYRPRVVVIIGRRRSYYDDIERIRLESSLPQWVDLRTYDDIVTKARHWRTLVTS